MDNENHAENPVDGVKIPATPVTPPPENHTDSLLERVEKPVETEKSEKKENPNKCNYILAGISVGILKTRLPVRERPNSTISIISISAASL